MGIRDEWVAWREERNAELAQEHGWLSLTALHFLADVPSDHAGLPGRWWANSDGVHVAAALSDDVRVGDTSNGREASSEVLDGVHTVDVSASGSTITAIVPDNRAIEVGVRSGRHILRVRDPQAPTLAQFAGVPVFDFDPEWVITAPVRWYAQPQPAVVGAAQPGLTHAVRLNGEVDLIRGGQTVTLRLVGDEPGSGALLFTDTSPQTAGWRSLSVATTPDAEGTVQLDFNRAYNMPCAFSDYGTCPQPVDGNDVPFAVTAGERRPR